MFQSTHSLRSATSAALRVVMKPVVSIHALLAECDQRIGSNQDRPAGFNPRTPCGVRLNILLGFYDDIQFQSTHSLRSATATTRIKYRKGSVSIHALLAECDTIRQR